MKHKNVVTFSNAAIFVLGLVLEPHFFTKENELILLRRMKIP